MEVRLVKGKLWVCKAAFDVPAFGEGAARRHGPRSLAGEQPAELAAPSFVFRSCFTLFREVMMNSYQLTLWSFS